MMNQISLFCQHCGGTLEISAYSKLLTEKDNRMVACYWCGRVVINCDVIEPAYMTFLRRKVESTRLFEKMILQLCALTGKNFRQVSKLVKKRKLDHIGLRCLIEEAAAGKWRYTEEDFK